VQVVGLLMNVVEQECMAGEIKLRNSTWVLYH